MTKYTSRMSKYVENRDIWNSVFLQRMQRALQIFNEVYILLQLMQDIFS